MIARWIGRFKNSLPPCSLNAGPQFLQPPPPALFSAPAPGSPPWVTLHMSTRHVLSIHPWFQALQLRIPATKLQGIPSSGSLASQVRMYILSPRGDILLNAEEFLGSSEPASVQTRRLLLCLEQSVSVRPWADQITTQASVSLSAEWGNKPCCRWGGLLDRYREPR